MSAVIAGNVIAILCVVALAFFFAPKRERGWFTWAGFCLAMCLTFWGWVIYVAAHFIGKFW